MATRIARTMAWALCAVLQWSSGPAAAQQKQLPVNFLAAGTTDATLNHRVGALVDVQVPFTVSDKRQLEFYLSPFAGEHGDAVVLQPSIAEMPKLQASGGRLAFAAEPSVLTLRLQGPALATAGTYTGNLAVLENGKLAQSLRIQLTRAPAPRPAKVVADPKSIAVYQRLAPSSPGGFTLQLRNTGADWPAEGVFLRLVEVTTPSGANFDPARNLKLTWNGEAAPDLWRSPPAGSAARSIAPNQQAEIGGRIVGLPAGEYAVKVGVGAANAAPDPEQQVSMKLYVKHRWGWALLVLLIAMIISYIATKVLESQRRRVAYLAKVAEIRPSWLREEPAPLPAIAARSLLKQIEDRNRSWWNALFGQDVSKAHIEKAERLLRILERVRRIQANVKSAAWDLMVTNRFKKRLSAVLAALDPQTVTEDRAKQIEAELGVLEQWFDQGKKDDAYWSALKGDMEILMAQIKPGAFDPKHRPLVDRLYAVVDAALQNRPAGTKLYTVEEKYAQLKILWERQQQSDAPALEKLDQALTAKPDMSIEDFLRLADGIAWERLKNAELEFTDPAKNDVDPLRAYDLVRFEIAPSKDRSVGLNYLFKHGVEYIWSIELDQGEKGDKKPLNTRRTMEPRLVHYCPDAGRLYVSVSLRYGGDVLQKAGGSWKIQQSSEYGWMSLFRLNEVTALVIAMILAGLSGMAGYYFNKPAFGGILDYMALFIWGAGVDQTKNFIQNLDKTSGKG